MANYQEKTERLGGNKATATALPTTCLLIKRPPQFWVHCAASVFLKDLQQCPSNRATYYVMFFFMDSEGLASAIRSYSRVRPAGNYPKNIWQNLLHEWMSNAVQCWDKKNATEELQRPSKWFVCFWNLMAHHGQLASCPSCTRDTPFWGIMNSTDRRNLL